MVQQNTADVVVWPCTDTRATVAKVAHVLLVNLSKLLCITMSVHAQILRQFRKLPWNTPEVC